MAQQIAAHIPSIHDCYRWARFAAPALRGPMTTHFNLDALGSIDSYSTDNSKQWGELATCVEEVMRSGKQADSYTPRFTSVSAVLDFEPSGQSKPANRPPRPRAVPEPKRSGCVATTSPTPVDNLSIDTAFAINDFDADQADMERQRELCRSEGTLHCHVTLPTDRHGMVSVARTSPRRDAYVIRKYLDYNRGAFSACWRSASSNPAHDAPIVSLVATMLDDGRVTSTVDKSNSGDAELDECLRSALADIWFPGAPDSGQTIVRVPLRLVPAPLLPAIPERDTVAHIATYAQAALDIGDGLKALRRYIALAGHAPDCEVHLGMLKAQIELHPWIDETVMAAARTLVDDAPSGACADAAMLEIAHLAHSSHRMGSTLHNPELLELAVERYKLALRFPRKPLSQELRANLVDVFRKLDRDDDVKAWLSKDGVAIAPQED